MSSSVQGSLSVYRWRTSSDIPSPDIKVIAIISRLVLCR